MRETYTSRGKAYQEIVRASRKMLELAMNTDETTGDAVLTTGDIVTILSQVDDADHFRDPMAQALFNMIMERDAKIVMRALVGDRTGSA